MSIAETPKKPRRHLRRRFLVLLAVVFVLLAIAGAFVFTGHEIAVNRVAEATAEQDALYSGWRLEDLEAARAPVADDDNGILVVLAAVKLLPQDRPNASLDFFDSDAEQTPNEQLAFFQRLRLRVELESLNPARAEARKLATRSTGRYAIVYQRNPLGTLIPHVQEARKVTRLLMLDALLQMEDGDLAAASVSCRAALNAGRSVGDEPSSISQLVRIACVRNACKAVEHLLAQGELDDANLAALQQIIEDEAKFPGLQIAYRGDRAMMCRLLQAMADGDIALDAGSNRQPTWSERCCTVIDRDGLRVQLARGFPIWNKLVEVGETLPHLRAKPLQELHALIAAHPRDFAALTAAPLERLETAFTRTDSYLNCLAAALAAERYRQFDRAWPPTLAALAPPFLATAPLDVFDAQPLRYASLKDGVVIYSLCPDAKGQVYDPDEPSPPGEGIAVRLWDVTQRKKSE